MPKGIKRTHLTPIRTAFSKKQKFKLVLELGPGSMQLSNRHINTVKTINDAVN